jgi:hypothetical protein
MPQDLTGCFAATTAFLNRVGQRYADKKRKGRLNQIMQGTTHPRYVRLVISQKGEERIIGIGFGPTGKMQDLPHHEQHDEATVRVNGKISEQVLLSICGRSALPHRVRSLLHRTFNLLAHSGNAWR